MFIAQNVLTAWLHTRASSGLTRGVEMELRGAMVHKLQRLSIQYHTQAQTGRLLSKIMRDVENVEQMMQSCFSSIVPLVTSVTVAVVVTALNRPARAVALSVRGTRGGHHGGRVPPAYPQIEPPFPPRDGAHAGRRQ